MGKFFCQKCGRVIGENDRSFTTEDNLMICSECYKDDFFAKKVSQRANNSNAPIIQENNKTGNVWTSYSKSMNYIFWVLMTLIFAGIGSAITASFGEVYWIFGFLIGGILGFFVAFAIISSSMARIRLYEDIAALRRNSDIIVKYLKDRQN